MTRVSLGANAAFVEPIVEIDGKRAVVVDPDSPPADALADLQGVIADLEMVAKNCDLIGKMGKDERKADVVSALIDSAIIRYRRCFATGVRGKLPSDTVESCCPEYSKIAEFFRGLADQHIDHSVSDMEHLICGVGITNYGRSSASFAGVVTMNLAGEPDLGNFARLGELARAIKERYAVREAERLSEQISNDFKAINSDALNKLPRLRKDIRETPEGLQKRRGR